MPAHRVSVCVHGHFYQPPRENPWTEEIELQDSAAPFHDWNERIFQECYLPNTKARVLNQTGQILDIVNNFDRMSFDFGPTLMSWMESRHPEAYRQILRADHRSQIRAYGHGNAIGQAYNHMIMPLANRRDKDTQVRWGIADFVKRFDRQPESLWLPETACDAETMDVLIAHGLRYVILAPHQAKAIRPLSSDGPGAGSAAGGAWQDVSGGRVDPGRPYRYVSPHNPQQGIDVFFYDGPVSNEIGFGDLVFDAKKFLNSIERASRRDKPADVLVSLASDGETYGHHKPFGDRALAYLLNVEAPTRGMAVVNFGQYAASHAPVEEVQLHFGPTGAGSSWSCIHGVERWRSHCGCRGGGPAEWTQQWRGPLRLALDWLRDELAQVFEERGGGLLHDVWEARNGYIDVVLDRSRQQVQAFLQRHAKKPLDPQETTTCLRLLEMQRHAMLMYTSCGWFFTELSGLETVQILQYAGRALELAESVTGRSLEEAFLARLSEARSNIPAHRDGRGVYEHFVRPAMATPSKIVCHYAFASLFNDLKLRQAFRAYELSVLRQRQASHGDWNISLGRVRVRSRVTWEEHDLLFVAVQFGTFDFHCSIRAFQDAPQYAAIEEHLFKVFYAGQVVDMVRAIDTHFGETYYSLKDVFFETRLQIITMLTRESLEDINRTYERMFEENRRLNEAYRAINLAIPDEIRYATEHALNQRLSEMVRQWAEQGVSVDPTAEIYQVFDLAASYDVRLDVRTVADFLAEQLIERVHRLCEAPSEALAASCRHLLEIAERLRLELKIGLAQEEMFELLRTWREEPSKAVKAQPLRDQLLEFAGALQICVEHALAPKEVVKA